MLGYACISAPLRTAGVFTSRSATLATLHKLGAKKALELLQDLTLKNIADLMRILEYNELRGIRFFRVSSGLVPHYGNPRVKDVDNAWTSGAISALDFCASDLAKIGAWAREKGHRLTMHPGQFCQLGSPVHEIVRQTAIDLECHTNILELLMTPASNSVLIIHGGGTYGDRLSAQARWSRAFRALPSRVQARIVLENDELWSIEELLPLCEKLNVPICVDYFHDTLRPSEHSAYSAAVQTRVKATWGPNRRPKCHLSEQAPPPARRGAHADSILVIPPQLLDILREGNLDVCLESKQKDDTVISLLTRYYKRNVDNNGRVEWIL